MRQFVSEDAPVGSHLNEYVSRLFRHVAETFGTVHNFDDTQVFRGRPEDGMLRYSSGDAAPFDRGPGFYYYDSGEWRKISPLGAFGAISQTTAPSGPDLGAGWTTVPFSGSTISNPYKVIQDPGTDSLTITEEGVYRIVVSLSIHHNETNQSRETNLRLFNSTDGVPVFDNLLVPIARNQPGSAFSYQRLYDITAAQVNKSLQVQMGGGDTVSSVTWDDVDFLVNQIA